jgi:hypothetical protein
MLRGKGSYRATDTSRSAGTRGTGAPVHRLLRDTHLAVGVAGVPSPRTAAGSAPRAWDRAVAVLAPDHLAREATRSEDDACGRHLQGPLDVGRPLGPLEQLPHLLRLQHLTTSSFSGDRPAFVDRGGNLSPPGCRGGAGGLTEPWWPGREPATEGVFSPSEGPRPEGPDARLLRDVPKGGPTGPGSVEIRLSRPTVDGAGTGGASGQQREPVRTSAGPDEGRVSNGARGPPSAQPSAAATARPAVRPEKMQPPRNVPSSDR